MAVALNENDAVSRRKLLGQDRGAVHAAVAATEHKDVAERGGGSGWSGGGASAGGAASQGHAGADARHVGSNGGRQWSAGMGDERANGTGNGDGGWDGDGGCGTVVERSMARRRASGEEVRRANK